ncbi:MAG TPA: PIN domain-containing protein [Rhizomicrobium sp.]|jgi:predicted nucleic acid-binding protein|nr:PIN domain-containing protein [Rhizomicrobium sp.]
MSTADFFDSNVLLYLISGEAAKAERTEELLRGGGTISVQVLNEIASVAAGKFRRPFPKIRELLSSIRELCAVHSSNVSTHERGLDLADRYRFSIYDSMLLASALEARCRTFYSEDLHHGQRIEGLTIRNPFRV